MNQLYTFLSIILVPLVASIFLYLYKSKCQNVNLCYGLISVQRDVRGEENCDMNNNTTTNTTTNKPLEPLEPLI